MDRVNLIQSDRKKLMFDPSFREAHKKYGGKWDRKRNRLRREIVRKKYWK